MALPNARNQYMKTQIETASREQLVVMLFDGIIRFTEQARKAIADNNIEDSHHALMRAQAIIMELICTVDKEKGGDIAKNLLSLHAYAFNCLIRCNLHKDPAHIDEVQKIYRGLRTAWVTAMEQNNISATKPLSEVNAPQQPTPPRTGPGAPTPGSSAPTAAAAPAVSVPASNPGLMAHAASQPTVAAATAPATAKPGVYGMGRTAMMGAYAAPAAVQVAPAPSALVATSAAPQKQVNAMLSAYGANTKSA